MDWTYNTLWNEQLPPNSYRCVDLRQNKTQVDDAEGCTYVCLDGFRPKTQSLDALIGIESAEYLHLIQSGIRSFEGIARLGRIKRLEVHYCLKLETGSGLLEISDSLQWLHINQSKKFIFTEDLYQLKALKVLCLNNCGPIQSLKFILDFPNLLDFRFVDTNVVDGDLTPLLEHPSLVSVGFLDKKHYNCRNSEVEAHFAERDKSAREYVFKGEWKTFRYRALRA